jgi:hypothetical protein
MNTNAQLFVGLTPLIQVFDMPRALVFHRDLFGFGVVSASPEVETPEGRFSHWTWLRLGAADLILNAQYDSGERPPKPDAAHVAAHGMYAFMLAAPTLMSHTNSLCVGDSRLSRQK